ncbi:hypothetical protein C8Q77DRAFT_1112282 [Trametes polyzona]|nr:hypothetical protein C8Q77DRAFT_1112282 [Trametes polyzona]
MERMMVRQSRGRGATESVKLAYVSTHTDKHVQYTLADAPHVWAASGGRVSAGGEAAATPKAPSAPRPPKGIDISRDRAAHT